MKFPALLLALALGAQAQFDDSEVLEGRDALEVARAHVRAADTYSGYYQPRSDIVVVRDYDASTGDVLHTAVLRDDEQAQSETKHIKKKKGKHGRKSKLNRPRSLNVESAPVIFERASRCGQYCSNVRDCTVSPGCPRCVHANRVKPPPARNDHQKVCGA